MPIFEIETPDGTFEVDAPDEGAALKAVQGPSAGQPPSDGWSATAEADQYEKLRKPGAFSDATDSIVARGLPFGDEIAGAMQAPVRAVKDWISGDGFDLGRSYDRSVALERELQRRRDERSPIASTVGSIAGGTALGGTAAKGGLTLMQGAKPTLGSLVGRGAGEGAAYGALYGAGEGENINDRMRNATIGGGTGALIGGATGALARIGARSVDKSNLPSVDDLRNASQAAYQRADDAGVIYSKQALQRVRDQIKKEFADFGYHPDLQEGARAALSEIDRLANGNVTFKGLDTARKIAGNAYRPGNKANNALTAKIVNALDNLVDNPLPGDIIMGNAPKAAAAVKEARQLYRQASKLDTVENLLQRAGLRAASTGSGGNIENATRQELRKILTSEKMRRGFTEQELKAIREAVVGSKGQDLLRLVGKLSPEGNGLSMMLHILGGMGTGGATLPAAGIGFAAKRGADALARNSASLAEAVIASGGNVPQAQLSPLLKLIVEGAARSGGQLAPRGTN